MIFLLAIRNLLRHIKNTILLSLLIAFITFVFFLGNSLLSQSDRELRRTYVDNLTADLMIQKTTDVSMNIFGANTPVIDEYFSIPVLADYQEIMSILEQEDGVSYASIVSGKAVMDLSGSRELVFLLGVELPQYFDIFPGIFIREGHFLEKGEEGVMLSRSRVESIETKTGRKASIGDYVMLTSVSKDSFRIREIPLVGIFDYENPGPNMEQIVLVDPQTVRVMSSVLNEAVEIVEVEEEALGLLGDDLDSLFSDDIYDEIDDQSTGLSIDELQNDLLVDSEKESADSVGGDWNYILMRLDKGYSASAVQKRLNSKLDEIGYRVVDWRTAAGNAALSVLLLQTLFYGGTILIGLAGVISIINIVLISVFKRTKEIGTLRAIGASDAFIAQMILLENFFLSLIAGMAGILLGTVMIRYINSLEIPFGNPLISAIFGGDILFIHLQSIEALKALMLAVLLGFLSAIFPGWKAIMINPIEAVRRG